MKQITELTEQEILTLTDEQLEIMVKYKMAESGIKILEYPKEPEYKDVVAKDELAYKVSGLNYILKDKIIADEIGAILLKYSNKFFTDGYRNSDYTNKFLKGIDTWAVERLGTVEQDLYYKQDTMDTVSSDIKFNKDAKEKYTEAVNEYNSVKDEADYIRIDIYGRYHDVINKHRTMADMKRTYESYLLLADGNTDIAMNFLKKAYTIDIETEYYVQDKEIKLVEELDPVIQ